MLWRSASQPKVDLNLPLWAPCCRPRLPGERQQRVGSTSSQVEQAVSDESRVGVELAIHKVVDGPRADNMLVAMSGSASTLRPSAVRPIA